MLHLSSPVRLVEEYVDINGNDDDDDDDDDDNDDNIVHENQADHWEQHLLDNLFAKSIQQQDIPSDDDDDDDYKDSDEAPDPCQSTTLDGPNKSNDFEEKNLARL